MHFVAVDSVCAKFDRKLFKLLIKANTGAIKHFGKVCPRNKKCSIYYRVNKNKKKKKWKKIKWKKRFYSKDNELLA